MFVLFQCNLLLIVGYFNTKISTVQAAIDPENPPIIKVQ
jgi:hypothetical protein